MKKIGIICPGRIGDIIMCLPIAKSYVDAGVKVVWPICREFYPNVENYISWVDWVVIDKGLNEAIVFAKNIMPMFGIDERLDLAFYYPGSEKETDEWLASDLSLDRFRYSKAEVAFEKKYTLSECLDWSCCEPIQWDLGATNLVHSQSSDVTLKVNLPQSMFIKPITKSVFDWVPVMENARKFVFIESCFSNLAEMLRIVPSDGRVLILKSNYYLKNNLGLPIYSMDWIRLKT